MLRKKEVNQIAYLIGVIESSAVFLLLVFLSFLLTEFIEILNFNHNLLAKDCLIQSFKEFSAIFESGDFWHEEQSTNPC